MKSAKSPRTNGFAAIASATPGRASEIATAIRFMPRILAAETERVSVLE